MLNVSTHGRFRPASVSRDEIPIGPEAISPLRLLQAGALSYMRLY